MTTFADRVAISRTVSRALRSSEHRLLLAAGDAVVATAAVAVALWLWSIPAGFVFSVAFLGNRSPWFAAAALWFIVATLPSVRPAVAFSIRRTLVAFGRGAGLLLLGYLALFFFVPPRALPRLVVLFFLWEAALLTLAWRLIFIAVFSHERFRSRAIIVGSGAAAVAAFRLLREHRGRQSDVEAVVSEGETPDPGLEAVAVVRPDGLAAAVEEMGVSELVLAGRHPPDGELLRTLLDCQEAGLSVVRMQTLYEQLLRSVPVQFLEPDWLMTDLADAIRLRDASWLGKRAIDVVFGAVGFALLALLLPFIAFAVWADSGRPIFYRQKRVGRGGRSFELVKFRTMMRDAERPGEARWADPQDPRVTRVGRFLRRTRLDELPQFLCVLRGDMSLVGPRPERAEFVESLQQSIPFYRARLVVPPGLTGWAQVNLPYGDTVELARQKLEFDLYYVKHRSLPFDFAILLKTFGTMLRLRGH